MAKTFADMTAAERAECVGMWASHQGHEDKDDPAATSESFLRLIAITPGLHSRKRAQRLMFSTLKISPRVLIFRVRGRQRVKL